MGAKDRPHCRAVIPCAHPPDQETGAEGASDILALEAEFQNFCWLHWVQFGGQGRWKRQVINSKDHDHFDDDGY